MSDNKILDNLSSMYKCKKIVQLISTLDAIFYPEWEYRQCSFDSSQYNGLIVASMKNDSREHYFTFFNNYGFIIKGYEQS